MKRLPVSSLEVTRADLKILLTLLVTAIIYISFLVEISCYCYNKKDNFFLAVTRSVASLKYEFLQWIANLEFPIFEFTRKILQMNSKLIKNNFRKVKFLSFSQFVFKKTKFTFHPVNTKCVRLLFSFFWNLHMISLKFR